VGLQKDAAITLVKVIIDTCVWSHFLSQNPRASTRISEAVARLVKSDAIKMLGPIRQELLSGAQPNERFEQLKEYLRFFPNLALDEQDDENAAKYYNELRKRGVQGTGTDLIICAAAVRHGLIIFTTDSDFAHYAKHVPIKLHRITGLA
jgi:predicted nucleic acid-binding protein